MIKVKMMKPDYNDKYIISFAITEYELSEVIQCVHSTDGTYTLRRYNDYSNYEYYCKEFKKLSTVNKHSKEFGIEFVEE